MNNKIFRLIINIGMIICLILTSFKSKVGIDIHKISGITFFILLIFHLFNNRRYIKNIFKVKKNIFWVINIIMFTLFAILLIASTCLLLGFFIPIIKIIHVTSAYSLIILSMIHLMINSNRMAQYINFGNVNIKIYILRTLAIFSIIIVSINCYPKLKSLYLNNNMPINESQKN